jgi:hypothetical protein
MRPGDVLAGRYRLVDLLAESGGGRFWRAHDRVLERHVALHVLAEEDPRAAALLDAARRSATVHDRHLLRVLDADRVDGLCFVVNEWGSGDSLDVMLGGEGPLSPRRAAWLVSEVAAAVAAGHRVGVTHGRLNPENVLVDHAGAVRVIGYAVDAAMFGLGPGRASTDVADLGGLLYAALTGRWPGVSTSAVPPAPIVSGRVLRPRQVRAGIPRALDVLCDEVINPFTGADGSRLREVHDLATAQGVADYLAAFVGDPSGLAAAEAAAGHRDTTDTSSLPAVPDPAPRDRRTTDDGRTERDERTRAVTPVERARPPATPVTPASPAAPQPPGSAAPGSTPLAGEPLEASLNPPRRSTELPTEAGMPVFDDDDEVRWLTARTEPAPPPPPFEDPPERPLFAPEPADGPARRARHPAATATPAAYWPWDHGTSGGPSGGSSGGTGSGAFPAVRDEEDEPDGVPGRSWLRLAAVVAVCLLLMLAVVVAYNLGRGRSPLATFSGGGGGGDRSPSASPTPTTPRPVTGLRAHDLDPQGAPPYEEHPELVGFAVDGRPSTAWSTMTYDQDFGPGGLKTGVGLVLDLGATHRVSEVVLQLVGAPTSYSLYVTDHAPTGVKDLKPVATETASTTRSKAVLRTPATGRYVTVWLTSIPAADGGFRGGIAEVSVLG